MRTCPRTSEWLEKFSILAFFAIGENSAERTIPKNARMARRRSLAIPTPFLLQSVPHDARKVQDTCSVDLDGLDCARTLSAGTFDTTPGGLN